MSSLAANALGFLRALAEAASTHSVRARAWCPEAAPATRQVAKVISDMSEPA